MVWYLLSENIYAMGQYCMFLVSRISTGNYRMRDSFPCVSNRCILEKKSSSLTLSLNVAYISLT